MSSKSDTGEPTEYDLRDEGELESALDRAWQDYGDGTPSKMRVRAQVEWSGVVDRANGGVRTTKLDGLNLGRVKDAVDRARDANRRAGDAKPLASYRAKGWNPQLFALLGNPRGSAAADRAGLNVTPRTLKAWLSGEREPNKANRDRIAEAYGHARNWPVEQAREQAARANHDVAQALNNAIRERYGAEVRLRDISRIDFE
jgi:transcriptional regulator with XRE-family HTH domain